MNTNDAKRQLNEEHALDEMDISENGPNLPNADKILLSAMNKYWQSNKLIIGNGKIYISFSHQTGRQESGQMPFVFMQCSMTQVSQQTWALSPCPAI